MAFGVQQEKEIRTQKARGLAVLKQNGFSTPQHIIYKIEDFETNPELYYSLVGKFVRPCPMVPRHGFVDSRPITTLEEAKAIVEETKKVEEKAEFIVMPFVKAEFSAIWTDNKLVIGAGNDGATSGSSSVVVPIPGIPVNDYMRGYGNDNPRFKEMLKDASVNDSPYVELLWERKKIWSNEPWRNYFVQLRNGPSLPDSTDYIPEAIKVTNVILAEGDLLEWETKATKFKKGTVVYHPNGSLASHYAVHAVLNNTPVLVSFEPKVGQTLKPNTTKQEADIKKMQSGFILGCTKDFTYRQACYFMLVGCHSTAFWLGKQDVLLGVALGCAYRLIITAALGEFRHQPGRSRKAGRNVLYCRVWRKILTPATRTRYMKALYSFQNDQWPSSFGGKKWLQFAEYAGKILNNLIEGNIQGCLMDLNQAVHAAHNGGWAFNKFIPEDVLDNTACNPVETALRIAPEIYQIIKEERTNSRLYAWFNGKSKIDINKATCSPFYSDPLEIEVNKMENEEDTLEGKYKSNPNNIGCGDPHCRECGGMAKELPFIVAAQVHAEFNEDNTNKLLVVNYKLKDDGKIYTKTLPCIGKKHKELYSAYNNIYYPSDNQVDWTGSNKAFVNVRKYNNTVWAIQGVLHNYYFQIEHE